MAHSVSQVNILSAGYVQKSVIADTAKHGLTSAVSLVPFVALVLLRTCKPLQSFSQPLTRLSREMLPLFLCRVDFNTFMASLEASWQADFNCIRALSFLLLPSILRSLCIKQRPSKCLASPLVIVDYANASSA